VVILLLLLTVGVILLLLLTVGVILLLLLTLGVILLLLLTLGVILHVHHVETRLICICVFVPRYTTKPSL
jgi:hypothetical protein